MKSREFATVSFVVVGLLYFAFGMSLLQSAVAFIDLSGPLLSLVMVLPTILMFYLGFYIIRVRDRLAEQILPNDEPAEAGRLSRQELATVAFAAVGLLLIGLGFPGTIKVVVQLFSAFRPTPPPSVVGAGSGVPVWEFRHVLPEALRVGSQLLFGLLVFLASPRLADRFSGTNDGS